MVAALPRNFWESDLVSVHQDRVKSSYTKLKQVLLEEARFSPASLSH